MGALGSMGLMGGGGGGGNKTLQKKKKKKKRRTGGSSLAAVKAGLAPFASVGRLAELGIKHLAKKKGLRGGSKRQKSKSTKKLSGIEKWKRCMKSYT